MGEERTWELEKLYDYDWLTGQAKFPIESVNEEIHHKELKKGKHYYMQHFFGSWYILITFIN